MIKYLAIFTHDYDGWYVSFPDIDNCFTQADTANEAIEMAYDVLQLHINTNIELKNPIPEAKTYPDDIDLKQGCFIHYINVTIPTPPVRVNISLPPDTLSMIDNKANSLGLTRSGFIAYASQKIING